jgi:hypothetical protein
VFPVERQARAKEIAENGWPAVGSRAKRDVKLRPPSLLTVSDFPDTTVR